jgi:hypothetical protein
METCRGIFVSEQNIHNMSRKLTKETYKKDESDAKSVQMWVTKKVFFYQEFNVQVEGNLHGGNMLFTIGI